MWSLWVLMAIAEPTAGSNAPAGTAEDLPWERLSELRERVAESRVQLDVLRAMYPDALGTRATLVIQPEQALGSRYDLVTTSILVDGQVVHSGPGAWEGEVSGGEHHVELRSTVRGSNRGLFTYLNEYEIELVSAQQIDVPPGHRTVARPVAVARPGFAYSFVERPAWWWEVQSDEPTPSP